MRLVWWFAALILASSVSITLSERGTLSPLRNLSLTVNAPVQSGFRDIASPLSDFFSDLTGGGVLTKENQRLKDELERYKVELAGQQDSQARIRELEDALGIKQGRPEDQLNAANVIAEDTSGFKRMIAIDLGENDGLDEGMVVLSRNGSLIGSIFLIYPDFAWVRLITDPDSVVNAQVNAPVLATEPGGMTDTDVVTPATPAPGPASPSPQAADPGASPQSAPVPPEPVRAVARGDLKRNIYLDLVPSNAGVAAGDLVLTSGHGGNYPRGLLIGTVKDVESRPQAPFKTATIEPSANLFGLDTVLVITSFKPARLSGP